MSRKNFTPSFSTSPLGKTHLLTTDPCRFQGQLPHDQGEEEQKAGDPDDLYSSYDRKFFWSHYVDSGFPNRVCNRFSRICWCISILYTSELR